jgi:hypothetical protein
MHINTMFSSLYMCVITRLSNNCTKCGSDPVSISNDTLFHALQVMLDHFEGFRSTFPKIGTKFDAHSLFLSLIHRKNRHGSRTQLQINACKNCPRHPTNVKLDTQAR